LNASEIFLQKSRYYLATEYLTKLRRCVSALPDDALWRRSNEGSNSIGNLLLHLTGNIREWIVNGVGGIPVERNRSAEFQARETGDAATLFAKLESTVHECDKVLASVSPDALNQPVTIQGRETTIMEAIYHVIEHFSMHTGQIIMLTKSYAPDSIHFYDDSAPTARPLWGGSEGIR
jgi:uncharacterized damage-inducible protein DinB